MTPRTPESAFADIQGFSASVRDIFERFACHTQLDPVTKAGLSYPVTERFARLSVDCTNSAVCQARIRDLPDASRKTGEWGGTTPGDLRIAQPSICVVLLVPFVLFLLPITTLLRMGVSVARAGSTSHRGDKGNLILRDLGFERTF